jgi:peptide/nickel transport system substrate-binding protein
MLLLLILSQPAFSASAVQPEELVVVPRQTGHFGGRLVVSLRSEPKTLNPLTSIDVASREVIAQMTADLIHIDRESQQTVPALAKSWKVSPDGRRYTVELRRGIRFSDGVELDADDLVFSFKAYLDEKLDSPQRDLLTVGGKPIALTKIGPYSVTFELSQPYASAERLFDSVAILPRHLLEKAFLEGKLGQTWNLATAPGQIAGLGPYRLKQYVAGQQLVLERNPFYWKHDQQGSRLPYLDEITFLFVPNEDAEILRFEAGETDVLNRIGAENYEALRSEQSSREFQLVDLGPSLEYDFLLFNLNSQVPASSRALAHKQAWFRDLHFRQAISCAVDREAMNRIVFHGRGTPLWTHVTPGNRIWFDERLARSGRSLDRAKALLRGAGFTWRADGTLLDRDAVPVEFSILTSASNSQRTQMATMLQQDLKDIGIKVQVVSLDFRAVLDRVVQTHDYEAAVMALGTGDVDPNAQMNVWLSSGDNHLWDLGAKQNPAPWQAEIDRLMVQQMSTLKFDERKKLSDRVQEIEFENLPIICLVTPNLLVAARSRLGNFEPVVLEPHTLWNSEVLFIAGEHRRQQP